MRKKELLKQSMRMFEKLQQANAEKEELYRTLAEKNEEIKLLKSELAKATKADEVKPIERLEGQILLAADRKIEDDFGVSAIGRLIIDASKRTDRLEEEKTEHYQEYINLILGKTEVIKREILDVCLSEATDKQAEIDELCKQASEYFDIVMSKP